MAGMRTAIVTGANKGIGLAIVRGLALRYPTSALSRHESTGKSIPLTIYLTARDAGRGQAAVQELAGDRALGDAACLAAQGGLSTIRFRQLDIADRQSVREFGEYLAQEHGEGVDILVNNAGIALTGFDASVVRETLATNYYGTIDLTKRLLPLINKGGRVVCMASLAGKFNGKYSDRIRKRFEATQSVAEVNALLAEFEQLVEAGRWKDEGWPGSAYVVSKTGLIAAAKGFATQMEKEGNGIWIGSCCPGWVRTGMTKGKGHKDVDEGAATPVFLALRDLADGGDSRGGGFWEDGKLSSW